MRHFRIADEIDQQRAHGIVYRALKAGILKRPERCEDCGQPPSKTARPLHGHHESYSKPLEVNWLCYGCHSKRHYKKGSSLYVGPNQFSIAAPHLIKQEAAPPSYDVTAARG